MPGILVYLGIGFLVLAISHGSIIDWSSAWTYAIILAWPFALIYFIFAFLGSIIVWVIAAVILVGMITYVVNRVKRAYQKWNRS